MISTLHLRIDWSEIDVFGHVNNVQILKYVQAARVACWEHIGLNAWHKETGQAPMVVSVKCDFKKPLYFPGKIKIISTPDILGNTSFGFLHQIFNEDGDLAAEARDVMVFYDFSTQEKCSLPLVFRKYWGENN